MKITKTEIAIEDVRRYYHSMFEPQLAAYHRVPRWRIRDWKEGRVGEIQADETIQNVVHFGGLSSGKSAEQRFQEIALSCLIQDNSGIIVRRRWEELYNHVIEDMHTWVDKVVGVKNRHYLISEPKRMGAAYNIQVYTAGKPSKIIIKPEPDGTDQQIEDHFKGPEYGWASLEEATQLKKITFFTLMGRLRRKFYYQFTQTMWEAAGKPNESYEDWVHDMSQYLWAMLAVSQPPYEGHWLDTISKKYEDKERMGMLKREDIMIIRSSMYDNKFTAPGFIRGQEELYADDPIRFDMLILGKNGIRIDGIPVYGNEFKSGMHTNVDLVYNPFRPIVVGMDFGYLRPAAVFLQETEQDQWNVLGEYCPEAKQAEEFGEGTLSELTRLSPDHRRRGSPLLFFGDYAGNQRTDKGQTTIQRLHSMGIQVYSQPLDFSTSLDTVRGMFTRLVAGRPRLMINSRGCQVLTQALTGGYHYKMRGGMKETKPHKTVENHFDDVCDALRYALCNIFGVDGQSMLHFYDLGQEEGPIFATGMGGQRGKS